MFFFSFCHAANGFFFFMDPNTRTLGFLRLRSILLGSLPYFYFNAGLLLLLLFFYLIYYLCGRNRAKWRSNTSRYVHSRRVCYLTYYWKIPFIICLGYMRLKISQKKKNHVPCKVFMNILTSFLYNQKYNVYNII